MWEVKAVIVQITGLVLLHPEDKEDAQQQDISATRAKLCQAQHFSHLAPQERETQSANSLIENNLYTKIFIVYPTTKPHSNVPGSS